MKKIETPEAMAEWVSSAQPGSICSYYDGLLMRDRALIDAAMPIPPQMVVARKMWALFIAGRVTLFQKKVSEFNYIYMAQKIA